MLQGLFHKKKCLCSHSVSCATFQTQHIRWGGERGELELTTNEIFKGWRLDARWIIILYELVF